MIPHMRAHASEQCSAVKERRGQVGYSIEIVVEWGILAMGKVVVVEAVLPWNAWPRAAGISYTLDSGLLELRQLRGVETGLVEGAGSGSRPVFATAVGALDSSEPRIGIGRSSVRA